MLSTTETRQAEREILSAARDYLGISRNSNTRWVEAYFEHGQWFVIFNDHTNDDRPERVFSVYDSNYGVGFEEL